MPVLALNHLRVAELRKHFIGFVSSQSGPDVGACLFFCGDTAKEGYPGNQRASAVLQSLFGTGQGAPSDVAVLVSSDTAIIVASNDTVEVTSSENVKVLPESGSGADACIEALRCALTPYVEGRKLAVMEKELPLQSNSPFGQGVSELLAKVGPDSITAATPVISPYLAHKDADGVKLVRKAAAIGSVVLKKFIMDTLVEQASLDEGRRVTNAQFGNQVKEKLEMPSTIAGYESLKDEEYGVSFKTPLVQCGVYDTSSLVPGVDNSNEKLWAQLGPEHGASPVVVSYGTKCQGYSAFIGRTFFAEGAGPLPPGLAEAHRFTVEVADFVASCMKAGVLLSDVFVQARAFAEKKNSDLAHRLSKDFGGALGLHILDAAHSIGPKGSLRIADGMTFVVRAAVGHAVTVGERSVDVLTADTVFVSQGAATIATKAMRSTEELFFTVEDEDIPAYEGRITRSKAAELEGIKVQDNEANRHEKQLDLMKEKHKMWVANGGRGAPANVASTGSTESANVQYLARLGRGEVSAYSSETSVPPVARVGAKPAVEVDRERCVLWAPVGGRNVPFHVSTIRKVDLGRAGDRHLLTVQFHSTQQANLALPYHRTKQWVKEAMFTSTSGGVLYDVKSALGEVMNRIAQEDAHRKAIHNVAKSDSSSLQLRTGASILRRVKVRPPIASGRGTQNGNEGDLEAHTNGLRFRAAGLKEVVVLYSNIKHVIFQPSKNDLVVVLHFVLKQPILVGEKKKLDHIQFIAEVMAATELASATRKTYDEEVADEGRRDALVQSTNMQFFKFSQAISDLSTLPVEKPIGSVSFDGNPGRGIQRFRGNNRAVWSVAEMPFKVISVDDVEVVSLERVGPGQKNCDAVFVMKGYKEVDEINNIPTEQLANMKDWMCMAAIVYFESAQNMSWRGKLLRDLRDDAEWEPWGEGGWVQYIEPADADSDEEETESDDETDEESDTEDSDDSEFDEQSEELSSGSDDSNDSDESWEEVERRAEAHDRRRRRSSDSDASDRPRRKATRR